MARSDAGTAHTDQVQQGGLEQIQAQEQLTTQITKLKAQNITSKLKTHN
jgi:hypothetical protein